MVDITLRLGDCLDIMRGMDKNSVDAIVCDPPYGLEFMGKEWDRLWDKRGGDPDKHPTGKAAVLEGFNFIGCDTEAEYIKIAEARIAKAQEQMRLPI